MGHKDGTKVVGHCLPASPETVLAKSFALPWRRGVLWHKGMQRQRVDGQMHLIIHLISSLLLFLVEV